MKYYYHFVSDKLRDGRGIPADGEWLEHNGELELCAAGLHASEHPFDALKYAPGNTLCLVELDGDILTSDDKVCAKRRRIVKRIDATMLMRRFAADQALSVAHLWKMPDIVREYLTTLDDSNRAAASAAAYDAARAAARAADSAAAAYDAASAAAYGAAYAAAYGAAAYAAAYAAARAAASDAAYAAARAAASDAASDAASAAARAAARDAFKAMVDKAIEI